MCRPIESPDSLGGMGPAAAALFAGYQTAGNKSGDLMTLTNPTTHHSTKYNYLHNNIENVNGLPSMHPLPQWAPSICQTPTLKGDEGMHMLTPPPSLPFVSFPKDIPTMPWMATTSSPTHMVAKHVPAFVSGEGMIAKNSSIEENNEVYTDMFQSQNVVADELEAAELEELLDFTMPDDMKALQRDKEDLMNLDDGFDGTEMSILYSFLVDTPQGETLKQQSLNVCPNDTGILNLNLLSPSPIDCLINSLDEEITEETLQIPSAALPIDRKFEMAKPSGVVKSRRLCRAEGCYKRSRSNGLCISHGGGRRCATEGCDKSSQGGNLCIRHGGGKRCSVEGCEKAAQSSFLCKAHGGGPRCQFRDCQRSSQGGGYCRSHGGGKRCMFGGCFKGTQRGDYCALHGGSRLCEIPGCMRNDRGGGLCATHGGGKRCTVDGCGKPCRRRGLCSAHLRQMEDKK